MHIAACNPKYVSSSDITAEEVEKEKEIMKSQLLNEGKPANIIDKIVEGRIQKFYSDVCLLEQEYIKDNGKLVKDLLTDMVGVIGENIQVGRFQTFRIGE